MLRRTVFERLQPVRMSLDVQTLMETFARYGPLASVKIMWPRKEDDDGTKTHNSGFVGFMVCHLYVLLIS
jgi:hypothetical protein